MRFGYYEAFDKVYYEFEVVSGTNLELIMTLIKLKLVNHYWEY